jgi:hypothetical protein
MIYCFDLDGTICSDTQGDYENAMPFPEMVADVNRLRSDGHIIIIFTARGSGTGKDWRAVTEQQLANWGAGYDRLIFGKPPADVYVDDKAVNVSEYRLASFGRLDPATSSAIFSPIALESEK